jgi:hypothetical protein
MTTETVFLSYIPFFDYSLLVKLSQDELLEKFREYTSNSDVSVEGAAWFRESNNIGVVLSVHNAEALATHMLLWAEGDIDRFQLQLGLMSDEKYYLMIMPDVQASFDRWSKHHEETTGEKPVGKVKAMFIPILFESTGRLPVPDIDSRIVVRFLDYSILNPDSPVTNENWGQYYQQSILIGELNVVRHDVVFRG